MSGLSIVVNVVYVLRGVWNYEGSKVLGVFQTKALAESWAVDNFDKCRSFDDVIVELFEVVQS
jgi:hypothetical protein